MEFKPVEKFPHNQIIAQSKINPSDLDENLKTVITHFNRKHNGYKMKPTEATEKELMALSTLISQNVYDYYVDKEDQEITIQQPIITPKEVKEIVEEIKEENEPFQAKTLTTAEAAIIPKAEIPLPELTPQETAIVTKVEIPAPSSVEPVVPPIPTEQEPKNKNEKALYLLFKEGVISGITKATLRSKGFDTDLASIRGCTIGAYKLIKAFSETTYKLEKI